MSMGEMNDYDVIVCVIVINDVIPTRGGNSRLWDRKRFNAS